MSDLEIILPSPNGKKPIHPNSLKNLVPFKKGQSGNPGGRQKIIKGAYEKWLRENDERTGLPNYEMIAKKVVDVAKSDNRNNVSAAKELRMATEVEEQAGGNLSIGNLNVALIGMMQRLAEK